MPRYRRRVDPILAIRKIAYEFPSYGTVADGRLQ
jgi:hypothetical protein